MYSLGKAVPCLSNGTGRYMNRFSSTLIEKVYGAAGSIVPGWRRSEL